MAQCKCPQCGSTKITDGKCEYCGAAVEAAKAEPSGQGSSAVQEAARNNHGRIQIIVLAVVAIVFAVAVWHKVAPHSMPVWLQQIVWDVRIFFTHETSWTIYGPLTQVPNP